MFANVQAAESDLPCLRKCLRMFFRMDFYDRVGLLALGSRLRRLGEKMAEDAAMIYALYGTDLQPRWFPVFYVLSERREESITVIADEVGHSHASVSQITAEMVKSGHVELRKGKDDGRKTFVSLTAKGEAVAARMTSQYQDVEAAVRKILGESDENLWKALAGFEKSLAKRSFYERVNEVRKNREAAEITIVEYTARFAPAFKGLNEEWIQAYFGEVEEVERGPLDDPELHIIRDGGHIFFALREGVPVATCALVPHGEHCFELAKMAVSPAERGRGIGTLLGQEVVHKAREYGAMRLYLESNTKLEPAIKLYRSLGFVEVKGSPSPYKRCNIQMELRMV